MIPNSVTSIKSYAFDGCSSLTSLNIPNTVTSMGENLLVGCNNLTSLSLPFIGSKNDKENSTELGWFFGGSSPVPSTLKTVTITNAKEISEYTFFECSGLETIVIHNGVTSIGYGAFANCSSLTEIIIPNSVTNMGESMFYGCNKLTSISLPFIGSKNDKENSTTLGWFFLGSSSVPSTLKTVTITNVKEISEYTFSGCNGLENIVLPDDISSIGERAFQGCSSLKTIVIPNGVTNIGEYAFSDCSSLTEINIPDSVTSIGAFVFDNCISITQIIIPSSVTILGSCVFYGWISSQTIYFEGINAPSNDWSYSWNADCHANIVWGYNKDK